MPRLNMARLVNQRIVEAVTEAVKEQSGQEAYDEKGNAAGAHKGPMGSVGGRQDITKKR
jgi:hypothetical protein